MVSKFIKRGTKKESPWEYRAHLEGNKDPLWETLMTCSGDMHIHQRTDLAPILTHMITLVFYSNCYKSCSYSL